MDGCICGWMMAKWMMGGCMGKWMDGLMVGQIGWMYLQMDGCMDGVDVWMGGQMDACRNAWKGVHEWVSKTELTPFSFQLLLSCRQSTGEEVLLRLQLDKPPCGTGTEARYLQNTCQKMKHEIQLIIRVPI